MNTTRLIVLAALIVLLPALAQAQDTMPSSAELSMPSSAKQANMPEPEGIVTTSTTTSSSAADTATGMPGDPCPNLKGATENAPDDLAKVQQDIDRFTLCVQRAQLLERLNESATKSIQSTDAALGLNQGPMAGTGGMMGMPPLPADALGGADVTPQNATPAAASPVETALTPAAEPATPEWQIREIYGSSVDMQARLLSPQGDELKVKKGAKLSDGSVVTSITPEGVSIRGTKGVKTLEWAGS